MILAVAFFGAVLIALARGGSLRKLADLPFRLGWLAVAAFGLQIYLIAFPEARSQGFASVHVAVLVFSYSLLVPVIWCNRSIPGIWFVGAGLAANLIVMVLNGGYMPISPQAVTQVGHANRVVDFAPGARVVGTKDILLPPDQTVLWWLSDIFVLAPPFPVPSVFSLGDLLIACGVFWLVQAGMHPQMSAG